jgi:outer membrane protein assembly factor BamD
MIPRYSINSDHNALRRVGMAIILITLISSSGCSSWGKEEVDTELLSAEALYGKAEEALLTQQWETALLALKSLEARYPYGRFAKQAQRWKGLITGRTTLADRDPDSILKALTAFNTIVNRYPNSRYKSDAEKRIVYLEAARAEQQISVARFYYSRGAYIAAINRSKTVLSLYGDGPQIEDALGIMYLSYQQMHLSDLANDTRRILTLNYPNSSYLKANIKPDRGWFSGLFKS